MRAVVVTCWLVPLLLTGCLASRSELLTAKERIVALESELQGRDSRLATLSASQEACDARLRESSAALATTQTALETQTASLKTLRDEQAALTAQLAALRKEEAQLNEQLAALRKENELKETNLGYLNEALTDMRGKCDEQNAAALAKVKDYAEQTMQREKELEEVRFKVREIQARAEVLLQKLKAVQ